jgi:ketosteroid isomerase-like protein
MSQENVEVVRRIYREVGAHGRPPSEFFDPAYAVDLTHAAPDLGVVHGVEASEAALAEYRETFDGFRIEVTEVIHADDHHVVTGVRDGGRLKGSDAEVWNRFFHVWTFRDGKIIGRSSHGERNQALEAAGLSE